MAMNSIDNSAIAHFVTDFVPTLQVTLQNRFTERTGYVFITMARPLVYGWTLKFTQHKFYRTPVSQHERFLYSNFCRVLRSVVDYVNVNVTACVACEPCHA